jgi:hypothetical protein
MPRLVREELTESQQAAKHLGAMGHSVDLILRLVAKDVHSDEIHTAIKRNTDHLAIMLSKDIIKNSENKKEQIDVLISELRSLIKSINDAVIIVPLMKDYYDVGIKNDEQLVKLAAIVQRLVARGESSEDGGATLLTDEERKQLMDEVVAISKVEQ